MTSVSGFRIQIAPRFTAYLDNRDAFTPHVAVEMLSWTMQRTSMEDHECNMTERD